MFVSLQSVKRNRFNGLVIYGLMASSVVSAKKNIRGILQRKTFWGGLGVRIIHCQWTPISYRSRDEKSINILHFLSWAVRKLNLLENNFGETYRIASFTYRDQKFVLPLARIWLGYGGIVDDKVGYEHDPFLVFTVYLNRDGTFKEVTIRATNWELLESQYYQIVNNNWSGMDREAMTSPRATFERELVDYVHDHHETSLNSNSVQIEELED